MTDLEHPERHHLAAALADLAAVHLPVHAHHIHHLAHLATGLRHTEADTLAAVVATDHHLVAVVVHHSVEVIAVAVVVVAVVGAKWRPLMLIPSLTVTPS